MSAQIETNIKVEFISRDRISVLFRLILVAPIAIFSSSFSISDATNGWPTAFLVLPALLALVFREVYPSYVLNFNKALLGLTTRIVAFVLLLQDGYPSIESDPRVEITFPEIDGGKKLNRFLPLVKWFFAIPLFIVGIIYAVIGLVLTFFAWIVTSATGNYPENVATYILATIEFWNRLYGYAVILVTDDYPPFSL